ncbi:uncharacterized protein LOC116010263 isoform X1 [Ipomoea triloba]|uniref:uncharacterized protein LOC116010263 isoform X1 n=1 Tax=Ipomoea triloba TaxID=35885 RepID=UPI00125E80C5|nr:uncharacterized protein LOC116010263 isoform X1 [Ipomoea triloba]
MVFLMKSGEMAPEVNWQRGKAAPVKLEVEADDPLEEEHGPLNKRSKLSSPLQFVAVLQHQVGIGVSDFREPQVVQYNPLEEPSPLGLSLRKSPSLLDLIQMRLSQGKMSKDGGNPGKKEQKPNSSTTEKLKASNFPATILKIGSWEYKSRYEGDLVAKCYFAKHKLVWEVLDGGLKNKIEIQWSDIMGIKATYPDDGPGTLDVVLARQPLFFRETNPQPRKHTLWQATSDFTGGQASMNRRHYLQCPQGLLGKHFEKLVQCDPRLNFLSQQAEIKLDSPYFESKISIFEDPDESDTGTDLNGGENSSFLDLCDANSPSGAHCSSSRSEQDHISQPLESIRRETSSPSSVMDTRVIEDIKSIGVEEWKGLSNWDQIRVPGLHPSMSMGDLVSHLEQRMSEQKTSKDFNLSSQERQSLEMLEEINRCLFSDTQYMPAASDEKSLMSRVNSLCCLLQKDPSPPTAQRRENYHETAMGDKGVGVFNFASASVVSERNVEENRPPTPDNDELPDDLTCSKQKPSMSRKDSVGDLLLNLPRITSLPQFLFNIAEDSDYHQAR